MFTLVDGEIAEECGLVFGTIISIKYCFRLDRWRTVFGVQRSLGYNQMVSIARYAKQTGIEHIYVNVSNVSKSSPQNIVYNVTAKNVSPSEK